LHSKKGQPQGIAPTVFFCLINVSIMQLQTPNEKKGMPKEQHFRRLDGDRQRQIACPPGYLRHTAS